MNAEAKVLFRDIAGAGSDTEANQPDGVLVTLTKWTVLDGLETIARDHYILETSVMLDHRIEVHNFKAIECFWPTNADAQMIRKAIRAFDDLVLTHPAFGAMYIADRAPF